MKGTCKICRDPRCPDVDAAPLLGRPLRAVAAEFGLARSTLHSHTRKHLRGVAERAVTRMTAAYTRDLRCYLKRV
jgi:hypothetical protein